MRIFGLFALLAHHACGAALSRVSDVAPKYAIGLGNMLARGLQPRDSLSPVRSSLVYIFRLNKILIYDEIKTRKPHMRDVLL